MSFCYAGCSRAGSTVYAVVTTACACFAVVCSVALPCIRRQTTCPGLAPTFLTCPNPVLAKTNKWPCWLRLFYCAAWYWWFPFILVWKAVAIFFIPCVFEYIGDVLNYGCFYCLTSVFGKCIDWRHRDYFFPPTRKSLGYQSSHYKDPDVEWVRCSEVLSNKAKQQNEAKGTSLDGIDLESQKFPPPQLFEGGIAPSDVAQGALGDCWLLSAIAVLAENPGSLERLFWEKSTSVWGKYHLSLYDGRTGRWRSVWVDDYIPCKEGTPLFTQPQGNEMWVLILEKAFAKFVGSYHKLEGGLALWALEALTGSYAAHFSFEKSKWHKEKLVHMEDEDNTTRCGLRKMDESFSSSEFFSILEKYDKLGAAMAAYSRGKSDKDQSNGIVEGHAYSVLSVRKCGVGCFIKLRNPWGTFSWKGDWSDDSPLWEKHPEVALELGGPTTDEKADDGVFWMKMDDFILYFNGVDVLDREVSINDLSLSINEADGPFLGPTKACLRGCFGFWCKCEGPSRLLFPHASSAATAQVGWCPAQCPC